MTTRRRRELLITDPSTHPRRYVSQRVAAHYLGIDARTLRKYLAAKKLGYSWFGGRRKIELTELVDFEKRQRCKAEPGDEHA